MTILFPVLQAWSDGIDEGWLFVFSVRFLLGFGLSWLPLVVLGTLMARPERSAS